MALQHHWTGLRTLLAAAVVMWASNGVLGQAIVAPETAVPEPGRVYAVTGVAAHDQLNVREQPSTDASVVSGFAHDERDILVTGVRAVSGSSIWWQVRAPGAADRIGWVNYRFLKADQQRPNEQVNYPLVCVGTEPFWSMDIRNGTADYSSPDEQFTLSASDWLEARGLRGQFAIRLRADGGTQGSHGYAAVLRTETFCSDNMSDAQYPFSVTLILPDQTVLGGCCSRAVIP